MTRRWRAIVVVALLGASAAACSDDGPGEGEARLEVDGTATVERADGDRETVEDSTDLGRGDRVAVTDGSAVMRLRGGTTFELREGIGDEDAPTTLLMASKPVLEAGDLLVTTPESVTVEADGTDVEVSDGAARVTHAFGMSASAYDADLALDSAGVPSDVAALRQVVVPDLGRPRPPRPVTYEEEDPWDRRYLGAAMALGEELEVLAGQLTDTLPDGEGRTVGFLRLVLPGLEDEEQLEQDDIDLDRDPGDTLIGAAISDLGGRGDFEERWDSVFGFRDDGAAWGLVALDQAVRSEPLIGSVEQAFNTSFDEVLAPPVTTSPDESGGTDTGSSDGGSRGPTDDGTGTDGDDDGPEPPSDPPDAPTVPPVEPPDSPEVPEPPPALAPVVEPVVDLVEDLLGGLLG